jgi:hypothetical protein
LGLPEQHQVSSNKYQNVFTKTSKFYYHSLHIRNILTHLPVQARRRQLLLQEGLLPGGAPAREAPADGPHPGSGPGQHNR